MKKNHAKQDPAAADGTKVLPSVRRDPAAYYDHHGVLGEIVEAPVEFALEEELRDHVLKGKRKRRLKNISVKLDEAQIIALRKIATLKSIPYQTLIRQWLAALIRKELHPAHR